MTNTMGALPAKSLCVESNCGDTGVFYHAGDDVSDSCAGKSRSYGRLKTAVGGFFIGLLAAGGLLAVLDNDGFFAGQVDDRGEYRDFHGAAAADATAHKTERRVTRDFFIAAEQVEWDYAPTGEDLIAGVPLENNTDAVVFVSDTASLIGRKYVKSLYKQYTDDTYTVAVEQPSWAGNLGPIIRAEVGDTIHVHFKNMLPDLPASIHPHGVLYTPENEGVSWRLSTNPGSSVPPGESYVYEWFVRETEGFANLDDASHLWFYHSHVDSVKDLYSGLLGPLITYERGVLGDDGMPTDVDEEFVILFSVSDENQSHYLAMNIETYGGNETDPDFEESNLMHSMNGYLYGNLPGLEMTEGDTVRWHVAAFGTEVDLHTAHWHGNEVRFGGRNVDVIELLPASFFTAIMTPDAVGDWQFHCHVNDHILAGMTAFYTVLARPTEDKRRMHHGNN